MFCFLSLMSSSGHRLRRPCLLRSPKTLLLPPHLVHAHRVFEPAQLGVAAIVEQELLAGHQLTYHIRHEDLATIRLHHDSRIAFRAALLAVAWALAWVATGVALSVAR